MFLGRFRFTLTTNGKCLQRHYITIRTNMRVYWQKRSYAGELNNMQTSSLAADPCDNNSMCNAGVTEICIHPDFMFPNRYLWPRPRRYVRWYLFPSKLALRLYSMLDCCFVSWFNVLRNHISVTLGKTQLTPPVWWLLLQSLESFS